MPNINYDKPISFGQRLAGHHEHFGTLQTLGDAGVLVVSRANRGVFEK